LARGIDVIQGGVDLSPDPLVLDLVEAVFNKYRASFDKWNVGSGLQQVYEEAKDERGKYLKKVS